MSTVCRQKSMVSQSCTDRALGRHLKGCGIWLRFEVWIICTRGTGHTWRKMDTFQSRGDAEEFVQWHKELDRKFPQGHYRYKIEMVKVKQ